MPQPLLGFGLDRKTVLSHHLSSNHFPPVDPRWLPICEAAIDAAATAVENEDYGALSEHVGQGKSVQEVMDGLLTIYPPDEHADHWTVSGDLRQIINLEAEGAGTGDSTNHVMAAKLVAAGWPGKCIDAEWSCFFAYLDTEAEAVKLQADALRLAGSL